MLWVEPPLARSTYTGPQVSQPVDFVCVRIYHAPQPLFSGAPPKAPVHIQSPRACVELDQDAVCDGRIDDLFMVNGVRFNKKLRAEIEDRFFDDEE